MALSSSPRKVVPLAGGDDWQLLHKPIKSGPTPIKRVFYCGVVVENSENGRNLPEGATFAHTETTKLTRSVY